MVPQPAGGWVFSLTFTARPTGEYVASLDAFNSVDGRMTSFRHEASYTTPWEISQATLAELETVG